MFGTVYMAIFPNGKRYIGSTIRCIITRINEHRYRFKSSKFTFSFYKEVGFYFDQITWVVLCYCDTKEIFDRENYFIRKYKAIENGYNGGWAGNENLGRKHTKESRIKKIATQQKNMPYFKVTCKKTGKYLITNNYDNAAVFVSQKRETVRKKVRGQLICPLFTYKYITGGGLSQSKTATP